MNKASGARSIVEAAEKRQRQSIIDYIEATMSSKSSEEPKAHHSFFLLERIKNFFDSNMHFIVSENIKDLFLFWIWTLSLFFRFPPYAFCLSIGEVPSFDIILDFDLMWWNSMFNIGSTFKEQSNIINDSLTNCK